MFRPFPRTRVLNREFVRGLAEDSSPIFQVLKFKMETAAEMSKIGDFYEIQI